MISAKTYMCVCVQNVEKKLDTGRSPTEKKTTKPNVLISFILLYSVRVITLVQSQEKTKDTVESRSKMLFWRCCLLTAQTAFALYQAYEFIYRFCHVFVVLRKFSQSLSDFGAFRWTVSSVVIFVVYIAWLKMQIHARVKLTVGSLARLWLVEKYNAWRKRKLVRINLLNRMLSRCTDAVSFVC